MEQESALMEEGPIGVFHNPNVALVEGHPLRLDRVIGAGDNSNLIVRFFVTKTVSDALITPECIRDVVGRRLMLTADLFQHRVNVRRRNRSDWSNIAYDVLDLPGGCITSVIAL